MTAWEAIPDPGPHEGGGRGRRRRAARRAQRRITSHNSIETLVEARRLLGQCDDAVLRTRQLLDAAGGGGSVVWYREARRRAELLETYSRELTEVLEAVEGEARGEDDDLPLWPPLGKLS